MASFTFGGGNARKLLGLPLYACSWVAVGLGDAVTLVLAFALVFVFSAVVQAAPKTAKVNKVRKPVIRRISIPPVCKEI